jgi:DNA end-binding protein Ku
LAETLIESRTSRQLEMARYQDEYAQKLERLIEAKVAGQQLVAAPASEPRHVLSLLDALKASVAQAGPTAAASSRPTC